MSDHHPKRYNFLISLILLIPTFVFHASIAKAGPDSEDKLKVYIKVVPSFGFKESGWIGKTVSLTTGTAEIRANGITLSVYSDAGFTEEATQYVHLDGKMRLGIRKGSEFCSWLETAFKINGKEGHTLILDADLADVNGKKLCEERRIQLNIEPPVTARFDLIGKEQTYNDIGLSHLDSYDPDTTYLFLHFTNQPKDIEIIFSGPVDRSSVENSINMGLKDKKESRTFTWKDDQNLLMHFDLQIPGKKPEAIYTISLHNARDAKGGFPVLGGVFFGSSAPCQLSLVDLNIRKTEHFAELNDKIHMARPAGTIDRYLLLDDGNYIIPYDLATRRIAPESLGKGVYDRNICFLDSSNLLIARDGNLSMRNLANGKETIIYSGFRKDESVDAIKASPDGHRVAILSAPRLYVVSVAGELIYQSPDRITVREWPDHPIPTVDWLDSDTILFDSGDTSASQSAGRNIYKVNLRRAGNSEANSGGFEIFMNNARNVVVSPKGTSFVFERPIPDNAMHGIFVKQGEREVDLHVSLDSESPDSAHPIFVDEDRIVYEKRDYIHPKNTKVCLFNLVDSSSAEIAAGTIAGLRADRRFLYVNSFAGELRYVGD